METQHQTKSQVHTVFYLFLPKLGFTRVAPASQERILYKHGNPQLALFGFFISKKKLKCISLFFGNKKPITNVMGFLLRRMRDSNPRTCYSQQFSRLPHSTTLPILLGHIRYTLNAGANIATFLTS